MAANYWQMLLFSLTLGLIRVLTMIMTRGKTPLLICPFPFAIQICANEWWTREWIRLQHESHAYTFFLNYWPGFFSQFACKNMWGRNSMKMNCLEQVMHDIIHTDIVLPKESFLKVSIVYLWDFPRYIKKCHKN